MSEKDLIKRPEQLPDKIEELRDFILIGKEKLKAYEAKLRAVEKIGLAKDIRDIALEDSQRMAAALLWAEARLGELLKPLIDPTLSRAGKRQLPEGITYKQSYYSQQLAAHKKVIEEAIQEAAKREDIPRRSDVLRRIKMKERQEEQTFIDLPKGSYRTIIIDPPWPIQKVIRQERPYQEASLDYPILSIEAIKNMKLPFASDGCHIYLWTIQRFLPTAFEILNCWDVKYIQTLVWHKNVGFTPFGLFMNNVEFVLFGRKGALPLLKPGEKAVFKGKVREHSRKPDEFYELVKKVSPEPRIDIFSREKRDGFDRWGNEIEKF